MSYKRSSLLASVSLGVVLSAAQFAAAQEVGATIEEQGRPNVLAPIIVTSQKRKQNLQDVAVSVTAFSGDQLEALGLNSSTEITEQIPGLQLNAWSPNVTIFNLRGISQNNFTDYLEAPVAVYLDDAYMGSINGISGQLYDTRRVEVLRGPQGTLFGRNATGGLIHFVSNDASDEDTNGYVKGAIGNFNRKEIEGAIGGSLASNVRARVSGRFASADGYVESAPSPAVGFEGSGQDIGGEDGFAIRGNLQVDFTEKLTGSFWLKYSEDNDVPTGGYVFANCEFEANGYCATDAGGRSNGTNGVINGITGEPASPYDNFGEQSGAFNRDTTIYQADFDYALDNGVELTSITNFTDLNKTYSEDADALPVLVVNFDTEAKYQQLSQEVRLSGNTDKLEWQVGAYYLDIDIDGGLLTAGAPIVGAALSVGLPGAEAVLNEGYSLGSQNTSVFGQLEYELAPALSLTAGLRYSMDEKSIDYVSSVEEGGDSVELVTNELFSSIIQGIDEIEYDDWAGRLALDWRVADNTLLFASVNRGIKGGNWTLSANVTPDKFQHDEEVLISYEAGVKTETDDGQLRFNATAYYYDYEDYQSFSLLNLAPQVSNTDATAYGGEFELFWSPTDNFNAVLGMSFQETEVDNVELVGEAFGPEFFPGAPDTEYCINQNDGSFFCDYPIDSLTGAELPNAPTVSLNYLFRYNVDALGGNIALQMDGVWYGDQFLEVTNSIASQQKSYGLTNLSASWANDNGLELSVFAKNVLEEEYAAYSLDLGLLGTTQFFGPPRTFGVTLAKRF
ncbi:TonB-dependent receptor [Hirschia litorea]|uniref:TonB-dependent receptor n=1 Tax=Hirschia litorea TaxID=1199156 RepID=A0ABW2IKN4_9PROT